MTKNGNELTTVTGRSIDKHTSQEKEDMLVLTFIEQIL
jgi:hypothetical protein